MSEEQERCLIIGLGNPGREYEKTRHNLGFSVVRALASDLGESFKFEARFEGKVAQGMIDSCKLYMLLPETYMNRSGSAVRKIVDYYGIPFASEGKFLVVVDDIYLPFGTIRYRANGSAGGHNGLKNIEEHLGSQGYARLRIGVGPKEDEIDVPLEEYVLGQFTKEEQEALPSLLKEAATWIREWIARSKTR